MAATGSEIETKMQPQPPPGSSKPMSALEKARARKLAKKQAQAAQAEQPPATPQVVRDVAKRTREELKKHHQTLTACFRNMDKNADNHVSLPELKKGFATEAHVAVSDAEARALFAAFDSDDDRRRQSGKAHQSAVWADLGALVVGVLVVRTAATAVAVGLAPGHDLHRAAADAEERGAEFFGHIAHVVEGQAGGRGGVVGDFERIA